MGFGAASVGGLGRAADDATATAALAAARTAGIGYLDTAPFYGLGLSERRVGDAARGWPGVIVSTKAGRLLRPDPNPAPGPRHGFDTPMPFAPVYDYTAAGVVRSVEDSLQRMGLVRLDIVYIHDIGARTHGADAPRHWRDLTDGGGLRALVDLRDQGVVNAIGCGVNQWEVAAELVAQGGIDVIMLAGRYTLLDQSALATLSPVCAEAGASVVIAAVYNSGKDHVLRLARVRPNESGSCDRAADARLSSSARHHGSRRARGPLDRSLRGFCRCQARTGDCAALGQSGVSGAASLFG